jgi:hypothetical protein
MKKSIPFLLGFILFGMVLSASYAQNQRGPGTDNLPVDETTLFAGSGICARCHEGLFENSTDVSPVTLWRSTMMANSAKDPLWRAKVAREGAEFPNLAGAIEEKCIKCHSPVLYKQSVFDDPDGFSYSIADLVGNPLARDGDTCTICHQILPDNFGLKDSFSGDFMIWPGDPDEGPALRKIYGPYPEPFENPMINSSNYTPTLAYPNNDNYTINDAEHCATCHNLFTNYVEKDGEIPEDQIKFPEQTPYYEWKNSVYSNSDDPQFKTCQGCHMPKSTSAIKISTVAAAMTSEREPFWYHHFVGGNYFMPKVLQDNPDTLGVTATAAHFDTTITNTKDMLQNENSVVLSANGAIDGTTLNVDVTLTNKAGHKLPTGIPLRRVWIHLKVSKGNNVIFESGAWDAATGEIIGLDLNYEPHHNFIYDENQVQIYEGVMKDDYGDVTRLLLRAKEFVKDNRLPPKGFSTTVPDDQYIKIIGVDDDDVDFNAGGSIPGGGSGADTVHYQIPISGSEKNLTVAIEVCYQTVTPGEVNHLTDYNTEETQLFNDLYTSADKAPIILESLVWSN